MSYQYLVGAEIDYTDGLEGAQFVIKNPNASTCGCGNRSAPERARRRSPPFSKPCLWPFFVSMKRLSANTPLILIDGKN